MRPEKALGDMKKRAADGEVLTKIGFLRQPAANGGKMMAKMMAAKMMAKWRDFGVQLASNWRVALVLEARHGVLEA